MSLDGTLDLIAEYYIRLSDAELDIDVTRRVLNDKNDFSPASMHQLIAKDRDAITTLDLVRFMTSMGESIEFADCFKLIMSLSPISICKMKLKEFLDFVCNKEYWNNFRERKLFGQESYSTRFLLSHLFTKELAILQLNEYYRKRICDNDNINIYSLFTAINPNGNGGISEKHIDALCKAHSKKQYASSIAVKALLKRLDKDKDGVVSYIDFFDSIKYYDMQNTQKPSNVFINEREINDELTPPKESNPQQISEEELNQVRKPMQFEGQNKPKNEIFDSPTRSIFNQLAQSYSKFKLDKTPDTKSQTLELLKQAKKALQSSFESISKSTDKKDAPDSLLDKDNQVNLEKINIKKTNKSE